MMYTSDMMSNNEYIPPPEVMRTAVRPKNGSRSLELGYDPDDTSKQFHPYLHIAEVEPGNAKHRNFTVFLNGDFFYGPVDISSVIPLTVYCQYPARGTSIRFSIVQANDSKLPPILNAFELYWVKEFLQSPTQQSDSESSTVIS